MDLRQNGQPFKIVCDQNRQTVGFLLARGPAGGEAFDANERSLGTFPDEHAAAIAVFNHRSEAAS